MCCRSTRSPHPPPFPHAIPKQPRHQSLKHHLRRLATKMITCRRRLLPRCLTRRAGSELCGPIQSQAGVSGMPISKPWGVVRGVWRSAESVSCCRTKNTIFTHGSRYSCTYECCFRRTGIISDLVSYYTYDIVAKVVVAVTRE